jgi:hypothetical protein
MTSLIHDLDLAYAREICAAVGLAILKNNLEWKITLTLESPAGTQYKYYINDKSKEE